MPIYSYRAADENGNIVKNKVQEKSRQVLIKRLKAGGLTPIDVVQTSFGQYKRDRREAVNMEELMRIASEANATDDGQKKESRADKFRMFMTQQQKITTRDLEVFTNNFYLLKEAGFNNTHALSTLVASCDNLSLKGILEDILSAVESGDYMYNTMEYYSDIFPVIYINLIKVGELSGSLNQSLKEAVNYLERTEELNKKLKQILIPNIVQFVVLFILMIVGSVYVVPIIQNVFEQVGSTDKLPAISLWFSAFLTQAQRFWWVLPAIILALVVYVLVSKQTPIGKYRWDYFKYKMPIFGDLNFAIDFSRLSTAMLLNLRNGMRIQEALDVSKSVVKNSVMLSMVEASINNIIVGESWVKPFEESGLPNKMVTEMLKIGMQTDLTQMMEKLVKYMQIDIDNILQRIVKVLPQILYVIIGIMIIFVTIVVLVPCIEIYMGAFLFTAANV